MKKVIQKPRQFVITGRGAYHGGENVDHSIAEAINFGISDDSVLEYCQKFEACSCDPDKWKWATHRPISFVLLSQKFWLYKWSEKSYSQTITWQRFYNNIFQPFNRVYSGVVKNQFTNSARNGKAEEDIEEEDEERPILKTVGKQKNVSFFPYLHSELDLFPLFNFYIFSFIIICEY